MKVLAKKEAIYKDKEGNSLLVLKIPNYRHQMEIEDLEEEILYSLEIKKARGARSNEQNRLMWALLSEIDKKVNGERSNDSWQIYLNALLRAGCKVDYIVARLDMEKALKRSFRGVEYVREAKEEGYGIYRVYLGSSHFNKKEMSLLIETVLDMAEEADIDRTYWGEMLR